LVELIVSIVILSAGVLSMAGTSAWVVRQITHSRLATERMVARQSAIETIRAVGLGRAEASEGMTTISSQVADTAFLKFASPGF